MKRIPFAYFVFIFFVAYIGLIAGITYMLVQAAKVNTDTSSFFTRPSFILSICLIVIIPFFTGSCRALLPLHSATPQEIWHIRNRADQISGNLSNKLLNLSNKSNLRIRLLKRYRKVLVSIAENIMAMWTIILHAIIIACCISSCFVYLHRNFDEIDRLLQLFMDITVPYVLFGVLCLIIQRTIGRLYGRVEDDTKAVAIEKKAIEKETCGKVIEEACGGK